MPDDLVPTRQLRLTAAVAIVVVVAVTAAIVVGVVRSHGPSDGSGGTAGTAPAAAPPQRDVPGISLTEAAASLAVLRDWDRARAAAWARGDVRALRRLYSPGAVAGERDVAMLRTWVARGLRVRKMSMQVLEVELVAHTERRIVLLVTDRLADARAVHARGGAARPLPRDGVTTRRLAFRRGADGWVLAAAYDRPAATTAVTSGSSNS